ncbi:MAG TPA: carboxyltransferase domain-containing protein, partial [Anaerolineae bacterium]
MLYAFPRLLPCGDAALLVEFGDEISAAANGRVRTLDADLTATPIPGTLETIPAYRSLLVEYDPLLLSYADLKQHLAERVGRVGEWSPPAAQSKRVPTIYGGEFGPDLEEVAAAHGLTPDQVVSIHSSTVYTVYMLGFSPGFAYMGEVP